MDTTIDLSMVFAKRVEITAPINSSLGIVIDLTGATRLLDAINTDVGVFPS